MKSKRAIIFNPSAGGGKAQRKRSLVETCLKQNNIPYDLFETRSEEHLVHITQKIIHGYAAIIAAGGDTTANIVATEILRSQSDNTLGIIGLGSVNDLARELRINKLKDAVRAIKNNTTKEIDIGTIVSLTQNSQNYFLVSASLGLGVIVNQLIEIWTKKHPLISSYRSLFQGTAGFFAIRKAFKGNMVPINLSFESEQKFYNVSSPLLLFSNTPNFGGKFYISPSASLDSMSIDCCIFNAQSFFNILKAAYHIKIQKHLEKNEVIILQNNKFTIFNDHYLDFQADGKILRLKGDIEISLLPKALTVFTNPNHQHPT